jgi:hypothetical protein
MYIYHDTGVPIKTMMISKFPPPPKAVDRIETGEGAIK